MNNGCIDKEVLVRGRQTAVLSDILTASTSGTLKEMIALTGRQTQPHNMGACTHIKENILCVKEGGGGWKERRKRGTNGI